MGLQRTALRSIRNVKAIVSICHAIIHRSQTHDPAEQKKNNGLFMTKADQQDLSSPEQGSTLLPGTSCCLYTRLSHMLVHQ